MGDNKFKFTYSAPTKDEREEIEDIRKEYLPETEREKKLKKLKYLDGKVKNIPTVVSCTVGIIAILIFGVGLCCVLEWNLIALGVVVSIVACVPMGFTHLIYKKLKAKLSAKYKAEILKLSDELLNEDKKDVE